MDNMECNAMDFEEQDFSDEDDELLAHADFPTENQNLNNDNGAADMNFEDDLEFGDGENLADISLGADPNDGPQIHSANNRVSDDGSSGFDISTGKLWIYPTNYPVRDYQYNIVQQALFKNTLVVLPTGLGKTFIAAVVMYNFYRWFPHGKVVFMAPTKPLVAQQMQACYNIMGIPKSDTIEMTGTIHPSVRQRQWKDKRVIFLTPQVMMNDLSRGSCEAKSFKCLVVDEAHKALGNQSYCQVIRELCKFTNSFRVLALSATPGSTLKAVQTVMNNLLVSHIELRSEDSIDIKPYTHERKVEKVVVPLGEELSAIKEQYIQIMTFVTQRLIRNRALYNRQATSLSKFMLLKARDEFRQNPPQNITSVQKGMVEADFCMAISLYHGYDLLQLHGLRSLYNFLMGVVSGEKGYGRTRAELLRNADFNSVMDKLHLKFSPDARAAGTKKDDGDKVIVGHPKMQVLEKIVVEHFQAYKDRNTATKVVIFSQFRDSVQEIAAILNQHQPLVKVMPFIGQSSSGKDIKGFTQKEQLEVMRQFREAGCNTLVSTCVGEEGLDIGDVDLIICFDAHKSPIRLVQRMGRTGRKREGKIVMLVTEGKEEQIYNQSVSSKKSIHKAILNGAKSLRFYPSNPRMVPDSLKPQCHKMYITVPEENKRAQTSKNKKTPFGGKRRQSIVDALKNQGTSSGVKTQCQSHLLDFEYEQIKDEFAMVSTTAKFLPKSKCLVLSKRNETLSQDTFGDTEQPQRINLSEWTPWQNRLQETFHVGHSIQSQHLVKDSEFIEIQRVIGEEEDNYAIEMKQYVNRSFVSQSNITSFLLTPAKGKNQSSSKDGGMLSMPCETKAERRSAGPSCSTDLVSYVENTSDSDSEAAQIDKNNQSTGRDKKWPHLFTELKNDDNEKRSSSCKLFAKAKQSLTRLAKTKSKSSKQQSSQLHGTPPNSNRARIRLLKRSKKTLQKKNSNLSQLLESKLTVVGELEDKEDFENSPQSAFEIHHDENDMNEEISNEEISSSTAFEIQYSENNMIEENSTSAACKKHNKNDTNEEKSSPTAVEICHYEKAMNEELHLSVRDSLYRNNQNGEGNHDNGGPCQIVPPAPSTSELSNLVKRLSVKDFEELDLSQLLLDWGYTNVKNIFASVSFTDMQTDTDAIEKITKDNQSKSELNPKERKQNLSESFITLTQAHNCLLTSSSENSRETAIQNPDSVSVTSPPQSLSTPIDHTHEKHILRPNSDINSQTPPKTDCFEVLPNFDLGFDLDEEVIPPTPEKNNDMLEKTKSPLFSDKTELNHSTVQELKISPFSNSNINNICANDDIIREAKNYQDDAEAFLSDFDLCAEMDELDPCSENLASNQQLQTSIHEISTKGHIPQENHKLIPTELHKDSEVNNCEMLSESLQASQKADLIFQTYKTKTATDKNISSEPEFSNMNFLTNMDISSSEKYRPTHSKLKLGKKGNHEIYNDCSAVVDRNRNKSLTKTASKPTSHDCLGTKPLKIRFNLKVPDFSDSDDDVVFPDKTKHLKPSILGSKSEASSSRESSNSSLNSTAKGKADDQTNLSSPKVSSSTPLKPCLRNGRTTSLMDDVHALTPIQVSPKRDIEEKKSKVSAPEKWLKRKKHIIFPHGNGIGNKEPYQDPDENDLDDFEAVSFHETSEVTEKNVRKKRKMKHKVGFVEEEAEVSGDENSSDEEEELGEDDYDMSFIDNHSETQGPDMQAVYLKSVKSAVPSGQYKLKFSAGNIRREDIYSQAPEESQGLSEYEEDSFCVGSNEEESEIETPPKKVKKGQCKKLKQVSGKRVIRMLDSSSEDDADLPPLPMTQEFLSNPNRNLALLSSDEEDNVPTRQRRKVKKIFDDTQNFGGENFNADLPAHETSDIRWHNDKPHTNEKFTVLKDSHLGNKNNSTASREESQLPFQDGDFNLLDEELLHELDLPPSGVTKLKGTKEVGVLSEYPQGVSLQNNFGTKNQNKQSGSKSLLTQKTSPVFDRNKSFGNSSQGKVSALASTVSMNNFHPYESLPDTNKIRNSNCGNVATTLGSANDIASSQTLKTTLSREERLQKQREKQEKFRRKLAQAKERQNIHTGAKTLDNESPPPALQTSFASSVPAVNVTIVEEEDTKKTETSPKSLTFASTHPMPSESIQIAAETLSRMSTPGTSRSGIQQNTSNSKDKAVSSDNIQLQVLVDSREISGAQDIISSLRRIHGILVTARRLPSCDYIVSNYTAVERLSWSNFSNSTNRSKLASRVNEMQALYDKCVLIVEEDRVKTGQEKTKKQINHTKYLDTTMAYLMQTKVKVYFTGNHGETASVLADLCQAEARKGRNLNVPASLNDRKEDMLNFVLSIPGVTVPQALNLVHNCRNIAELISSPIAVIQEKGQMSQLTAQSIHKFFQYSFDEQMMPESKR